MHEFDIFYCDTEWRLLSSLIDCNGELITSEISLMHLVNILHAVKLLSHFAQVIECPPSSSVANYRPISITSALFEVFERLVSVRLGRFMERSGVLPTTQFAYRKVWVLVMHFCACPIHSKVHLRVGRYLGSCRLISVQLLIGSKVGAFSISSALWVLEVLCCLY